MLFLFFSFSLLKTDPSETNTTSAVYLIQRQTAARRMQVQRSVSVTVFLNLNTILLSTMHYDYFYLILIFAFIDSFFFLSANVCSWLVGMETCLVLAGDHWCSADLVVVFPAASAAHIPLQTFLYFLKRKKQTKGSEY